MFVSQDSLDRQGAREGKDWKRRPGMNCSPAHPGNDGWAGRATGRRQHDMKSQVEALGTTLPLKGN